jgi:hypothetical protein
MKMFKEFSNNQIISCVDYFPDKYESQIQPRRNSFDEFLRISQVQKIDLSYSIK